MTNKKQAEAILNKAWKKAAQASDGQMLKTLREAFEAIEFEDYTIVKALTEAQAYELEMIGAEDVFLFGSVALVRNANEIADEAETECRIADRVADALGMIFSDNVNEDFIERSIKKSANALARKLRN